MSVTTSIRLPDDLRAELDAAAKSLHRGKNWVIAQALREYLARLQHDALAQEARRQSLTVVELTDEEREWMDSMDETGWKP